MQTFSTLPEVIHDYILSYLSNLEDLLTICRVSMQLQEAASRFNEPLVICDREWTKAQWIRTMEQLVRSYKNITDIRFRRCNIQEEALIKLFQSETHIIDLRECRQILNDTKWLSQLDDIRCNHLALAKCSKLDSFPNLFENTTSTSLRTLCLDRIKIPEDFSFADRFSNLQTLVLTNSKLCHHKHMNTKLPLSLLELSNLENLFLGGSGLFDPRFERIQYDITTICRVLEVLEQQIQCFKASNPITLQNSEMDYPINFTAIYNNAFSSFSQDTASPKSMALISRVHDLLLLFHRLQQRGLKVLGLSFHKPDGGIPTISKLKALKEVDGGRHFDGLVAAKLLFTHLMHSQFGDVLTIFDFSRYPVVDTLKRKEGDIEGKLRGLHQLCGESSDFEHLRLAIEYVVDLAMSPPTGQTALHIACSDEDSVHREYVQELLAHNVWPDARDYRGRTPLYHAAVHNHYEIAQLLIENGADIFKKRTTKETPMEIACMRSHLETVTVMLKAASIEEFNQNEKYDNEWSPVHCCVISRNKEMLKLLMDKGLDYAARNHWKQTPLHICAVKDYVDLTRILLEKYSLDELLLPDEFGKTAQNVARRAGNMEIMHLIQDRRRELEQQQRLKRKRESEKAFIWRTEKGPSGFSSCDDDDDEKHGDFWVDTDTRASSQLIELDRSDFYKSRYGNGRARNTKPRRGHGMRREERGTMRGDRRGRSGQFHSEYSRHSEYSEYNDGWKGGRNRRGRGGAAGSKRRVWQRNGAHARGSGSKSRRSRGRGRDRAQVRRYGLGMYATPGMVWKRRDNC